MWQDITVEKVYFDSALGAPGTDWPIGSPETPSNVIADVITICAARNLRAIDVRGALTLGAAMSGYSFYGHKHLDVAYILTLNGQDVSVSSFHDLVLTGAQGGAGLAAFDDCQLVSVTGFNGTALRSGLTTALGLVAATTSQFIDCYSYLGTCTITLGTPTVANFINLTGSVILAGQTAGVTNIWAGSGCEIVINASCNGGTINIWGSAYVTDNSAAGCTVNNYTLQATRPQSGTQATTAALAVVGTAIEHATIPFEVSGYLSLHNMVAGDIFLVLEEVRDQDDATYREYGRTSYSGVQTSPMVWFEPKDAMGWRLRIQRTAGADRNVTYQFFRK